MKRGLGVKEGLGIGYEKIDQVFSVDLNLPVYEDQVVVMNEELEGMEIEGWRGIFDKGFDWKLEVIRYGGRGDLEVKLEGMIERDFDLYDLESEIWDIIGSLDIVCSMREISGDVWNNFGDDDDLGDFLDDFERSLYNFDEDCKEELEKNYEEGYVPSEELEERMIEMMNR
jgi:hypothetical protein